MTEFPALRDALVDAGRRRRRRRRRALGAVAPALVVAGAIAAFVALPASDPEHERTTEPSPAGAIEQAFGIFRRPQVPADVVPAAALARELHGDVDRARSRLLGRSGQARVYVVPAVLGGTPRLCLVAVGPSSSSACAPLDGRAPGEDFAPALWAREQFALLLPDGTRDVLLTLGDGSTTRPRLRDHAVVVREPATVGLASWTGASGTRYTQSEPVSRSTAPPRTCPPALDPLPADAAERATGVASIVAGGLYPSAEVKVSGAARPKSTPCSDAVTARTIEVRLSANRSARRLLLGMIGGQLTVYYVLH